jgi:hypothetical protein
MGPSYSTTVPRRRVAAVARFIAAGLILLSATSVYSAAPAEATVTCPGNAKRESSSLVYFPVGFSQLYVYTPVNIWGLGANVEMSSNAIWARDGFWYRYDRWPYSPDPNTIQWWLFYGKAAFSGNGRFILTYCAA